MTAQVPEILIHRGIRLNLCVAPLGNYLNRLPKRRRPEFVSTCTACHRGYVGTWEIRDGYLHLVALEGLIRTPDGFAETDLRAALPWLKDTLRATWLTDRVRCPEGRLVSYIHHAYASQYERDRIFEFERGRLISEWVVLNPPEPIIYRIDADARRTCVDGLCSWDEVIRPDPLGEDDFTQVYKLWNRPPAVEEDDNGAEAEYVIAAACIHPPR